MARAEVTMKGGRGCVGTGMLAQGHPAHLDTELTDLQLQLPHLGLSIGHHGPQLGHKAAALLGLTVDLLVQVLLRGASRFLLHTQAAQNVLQLL